MPTEVVAVAGGFRSPVCAENGKKRAAHGWMRLELRILAGHEGRGGEGANEEVEVISAIVGIDGVAGRKRNHEARAVESRTGAGLHPAAELIFADSNDAARRHVGDESVPQKIDVLSVLGAVPGADQVRGVRLKGYEAAVAGDRRAGALAVC